MGGYREGSGRSKSGYYNGIYCGSTYELCWVIHSIDNNIIFDRFPGKLKNNGVVYYPDFLLEDGVTIIETKGFENEDSVSKKTQVAKSFGYKVIVLRKDDLQYAFDYVEKKFGTKKFYTLYDHYKPKFSHNCDYCQTLFDTDRKIKTETKFCSRSCAGKYRKKFNTSKVDAKNGKYKRFLDKETALQIFHRTDKSLQGLAEEYGIPKNNIWFIKQKKTYKWIHE